MSVNNRAEFQATLDTKPVDRSLAETERRMMTLDGGAARLQGALNRIDNAASNTVKRGLGSLSFALGGTAGKAAEVVDAAGDIAQAFSTGGVAGIGFAAAAVAAVKVAEAYQEAAANSRIFGEATKETAKAIQEAANVQLAGYIGRIDELKKSLQNFGLSGGQILVRDLKNQVAADDARLGNLEDRIAIQRQRTAEAEEEAAALRGAKFKQNAETQRAILTQLEARAAGLKQSIDTLRPQIAGAELAAFTERALAKMDEKAPAASPLKIISGHDTDGSDSFQNQLNAMQARADAEGAAILAIDEKYAKDMADQAKQLAAENAQVDSEIVQQRMARFDIETELTQMHTAQQIAALDRVEAAYTSLYMDAIPGVLGNATGALNEFFVGIATGQEKAFELASASFLQSTGQQLVGLGTKAVWEGAIISANPLTPGAGLPMVGIGLGAIAAGIGMGAGGAALAASASPPLSAGSGRGAETRGTGFGGGNTGGGGNTVVVESINISYAAAGPAPEQTGRVLRGALETLNSRQGVPRPRQGPLPRR